MPPIKSCHLLKLTSHNSLQLCETREGSKSVQVPNMTGPITGRRSEIRCDQGLDSKVTAKETSTETPQETCFGRSRHDLKQHINVHHNHCEICDKRYESRRSLHNHMNKHHYDEKPPDNCKICK